MIIQLRKARALFRQRGLALTHQRLAVYRALAGTDEHPSAEALYRRLKRRVPSLSLATVYKNLRALQNAGLASVVDTPGGETRFDAMTGTHHHAICSGCGRIQDVVDPALDRLRPPSRLKGFRTARHSVQFHGICVACSRSERRSKR